MPSPAPPLTGGCRCDRLRFAITASPMLSSACHCRGCQRMTGGPYALTLTVAVEAFEVTRGEAVVGGCQGPLGRHMHCEVCKSWVYTLPAAMPTIVNVRTPMLDDPTAFAPFVEVQAAEKLAFADTGAPHSFQRWPADAEWPALIAAYRAA